MRVFAISDLHLSLSGSKPMDVFGEKWRDHEKKIAAHWRQAIGEDDLVLVAGDISWAKRIEEAAKDLAWMDALPGEKVIVKGNHDYWWTSIGKVRRLLPKSIHALQNDAYVRGDVGIGGTRLWEKEGLDLARLHHLGALYDMFDFSGKMDLGRDGRKIWKREILRLAGSLSQMEGHEGLKIAMTHFPPTDREGTETEATRLLEKCGVSVCVFGHLHDLDPSRCPSFDVSFRGVRYVLTSCDFIGFNPVRIV